MGDHLKDVMLRAAADMRALRRENEVMRAKLDGFDLAVQLLYATPPQKHGIGMSEDMAWRLEREAEQIAINESNRQATGE